MAGLILIIAIVAIIALGSKKKTVIQQKNINPKLQWAIDEGYGIEIGKQYIDHLSDMQTADFTNIENEDIQGFEPLKDYITAVEYLKDGFEFQECYDKLRKPKDKFVKIEENETISYETEINSYRLKKQYRGVARNLIFQEPILQF